MIHHTSYTHSQPYHCTLLKTSYTLEYVNLIYPTFFLTKIIYFRSNIILYFIYIHYFLKGKFFLQKKNYGYFYQNHIKIIKKKKSYFKKKYFIKNIKTPYIYEFNPSCFIFHIFILFLKKLVIFIKKQKIYFYQK